MYSREKITQEKNATEIKVTLEAPDMFYKTGYLVLENLGGKGFVPCVKISNNGKLQIVYNISHYISLSEMLPEMTPQTFVMVVENLLECVKDLHDIGFLQCENIFLSNDRIFIDINNLSVHLLYLPIVSDENQDCLPLFEKKLKENIIRIANTYRNVVNEQTGALMLRIGSAGAVTEKATTTRFVLNSVGTTSPCQFAIDKSSLTIGKSSHQADAVVPDCTTVSRVHCRLSVNNGYCYISDLNSTNGSFINGTRLQPEHPYRLSDGDRVRLAKEEFVFSVEQVRV